MPFPFTLRLAVEIELALPGCRVSGRYKTGSIHHFIIALHWRRGRILTYTPSLRACWIRIVAVPQT